MKPFSDLDNWETSSPPIIPPIHPSAALRDSVGLPAILLNPTKKVYVYRNLHKHQLSIQQQKLIVGYAEGVILTDVEFRVRESGRQRCLREKQKNVHAFAIGLLERTFGVSEIDEYSTFFDIAAAYRVTYNPYRQNCFYNVATEAPVTYGARVLVTANNGIYVEKENHGEF